MTSTAEILADTSSLSQPMGQSPAGGGLSPEILSLGLIQSSLIKKNEEVRELRQRCLSLQVRCAQLQEENAQLKMSSCQPHSTSSPSQDDMTCEESGQTMSIFPEPIKEEGGPQDSRGETRDSGENTPTLYIDDGDDDGQESPEPTNTRASDLLGSLASLSSSTNGAVRNDLLPTRQHSLLTKQKPIVPGARLHPGPLAGQPAGAVTTGTGFKCRHCMTIFRTHSALQQHQRTSHREERPFMCHLCQSTFSKSYSLKCHVMQVHTGERPHACHICTMAFVKSSDLKRHMSVHVVSDARRYQCSHCQASFTNMTHLRRHEVSVHETDDDNLHVDNSQTDAVSDRGDGGNKAANTPPNLDQIVELAVHQQQSVGGQS